MNILGRQGAACEAYQPASGLTSNEVGNIQRYLDAVRSNLLFAKSVVLVEGDAEEILIPILFRKILGLSLDELGVSLINIRSTGFENVAVLFHNKRIKKRCSIITDLDVAIIDTTLVPDEPESEAKYKAKCLRSQAAGAARRIALDTFAADNDWLSTHYAEHTFEVDFIAAGNGATVAALASMVYSDQPTIVAAEKQIMSGFKEQFGRRVLTMAANQGKGWFAILLGKNIDHKTIMPGYILDAILFARQRLSTEIFFNIYNYRIKCALASGDILQTVADVARDRLEQYRVGTIDLVRLKAAMLSALPSDQIHVILLNVA
jgi:putative ATP-dependent endonuclease of OLD family